MSTTATDLAAQKRQVDEQKRLTDKLILDQKDMLRKNIANIDSNIAELQTQRSHAQSDLSRLG